MNRRGFLGKIGLALAGIAVAPAVNLPEYKPVIISSARLNPLDLHQPEFYKVLMARVPRYKALDWMKSVNKNRLTNI